MVIVAIVGIDGCGKTTQCKLLVESLNRVGHNAVYIRPLYLFIDLLPSFIKRKIVSLSLFSPRKSATYNSQHKGTNDSISIYDFIRKAIIYTFGYTYVLLTCIYLHLLIDKNKYVVCDRYFLQFLIDIYDKKARVMTKVIPMPDMVFYLKGDIDMFLGRMSDLFDKSVKKTYYENVLCMLNELSVYHHFFEIDAKMDAISISNIICEYFICDTSKIETVNALE